jgi:hypothetical protein
VYTLRAGSHSALHFGRLSTSSSMFFLSVELFDSSR